MMAYPASPTVGFSGGEHNKQVTIMLDSPDVGNRMPDFSSIL
jgi:hypothetical protein